MGILGIRRGRKGQGGVREGMRGSEVRGIHIMAAHAPPNTAKPSKQKSVRTPLANSVHRGPGKHRFVVLLKTRRRQKGGSVSTSLLCWPLTGGGGGGRGREGVKGRWRGRVVRLKGRGVGGVEQVKEEREWKMRSRGKKGRRRRRGRWRTRSW